jgi:ribosomal protein L27
MIGGFSTPKKDKAIKVSSGMLVKTGQILVRGLFTYKAGLHVKGKDTLHALCPGRIYFSKRKTSKGKVRTFVNIAPLKEKS